MRCCMMWVVVGVLLLALTGCGTHSAEQAGTGAEAAVRSYYDALIHKDWAGAYAALHPESRKRTTKEQFVCLAQNYRKNLAFEPLEVRIRSCEEHGDEAVARVILSGQGAGKQRTFQDGITLRRSGSDWRIILSPRFGEGS
jgi:hypothetical protein